MNYRGVLGLPRLTGAGPFVKRRIQLSQKLTPSRAEIIVEEVAKENGIPRTDMSEAEFNTLVEKSAEKVYPGDEKVPESVTEAKRNRFIRCMKNSWVMQWVIGLAESDKVDIEFEDELGAVKLMMRGCVGMNESNTSDDERIIPERFK